PLGQSARLRRLLPCRTYSPPSPGMKPRPVLTLREMPFYYYPDADNDQIALPCTERMLSSKMAELVLKCRFMPMLSMKGTPEVRLGGFRSLAGANLAGPWQPVAASSAAPAAPEPVEEEAPAEEEAAPPEEAE